MINMSKYIYIYIVFDPEYPYNVTYIQCIVIVIVNDSLLQ